jgi:hypothetical protein
MPTILSRRSGGTNGGGESDAAFTPSPPIPGLGDALSKTLAHQTKIRNLYSTPVRPDSSSSASSATDWEGEELITFKKLVFNNNKTVNITNK